MISVNEARKILSENLQKGMEQKVYLNESLGLITAKDIRSPIDVPSFNNSAMDGYAMRFDGSSTNWDVVTTIQAGETSEKKIEPGEAARIFTGAKMPEGADTVIPQELVEFDESSRIVIYKEGKTTKGSNVRVKDSQCKKGDLVLREGSLITPGVIGLLASVGLMEVKVYAPPGVAYVITGNELKEPGTTLKEGEIYNSNGPMLEALLNQVGIKDPKAFKVSDDKEELQKVINKTLAEQDLLILSGGISVGDYDFVKECLKNAGVEELFYKIKQRPGKPMFAGKKNKQWVFALPGNPASVLSCFNQYVKPCLRGIMGQQKVWEPDRFLSLAEDHQKKKGFTFIVKARTVADRVEILKAQQSFNLQAFSTADCLVELEEEKELIEAGTLVPVHYL